MAPEGRAGRMSIDGHGDHFPLADDANRAGTHWQYQWTPVAGCLKGDGIERTM